MIDVSKLTPAQIRQLGIKALAQVLGPVGMGLFIHQFEIGSENYTRERDKILGNRALEEIITTIKEISEQQTEDSETLAKVTNEKIIDVSKLTQAEIRQMGIQVLYEALGSAGMMRFMHQFEMGSGDYTRDRDKILGNITLDDIFASIEEEQQQQEKENFPAATALESYSVTSPASNEIVVEQQKKEYSNPI
jgi:3-dehydroquinate dehydratase